MVVVNKVIFDCKFTNFSFFLQNFNNQNYFLRLYFLYEINQTILILIRED